jgi:hypothetical protein
MWLEWGEGGFMVTSSDDIVKNDIQSKIKHYVCNAYLHLVNRFISRE